MSGMRKELLCIVCQNNLYTSDFLLVIIIILIIIIIIQNCASLISSP